MRKSQKTALSLITCFGLFLNGTQATGQTFLAQANDILDKWTGRKDKATSLLSNEDQAWAIRTTAAQLYPALVLTSWFTNQDLHNGLLLETLRDEQKLTSRLSVFPDDYDLWNHRFVRSSRKPDEILVNAAAYADGLARVASVTGHGPWTDRLRGIVDALFLRADVSTGYAEGPLPSSDIRVIGRILKTLPLLSARFRDDGYLYYARRICDAYCVGVMPKNGGLPAEHWDFDSDKAKASSLILNQDGVSFIEGLVALYAVETIEGSARANIYRPTLSAMFDVLFKHGVKENGRFYRRIQPDNRGGYSIDRKRESAYTIRILTAAHRYGQLSGNETYSNRAVTELSKFSPDPDERTASIPALITAMTFSAHAVSLVDSISSYLKDGNIPRQNNEESVAETLNALMALVWRESAGVRATPWRSDLVIRSISGNGLSISIEFKEPWQGVIRPSYDRRGTHAIGFPNIFSLSPAMMYEIQNADGSGKSVFPAEMLSDGLRANLQNDYRVRIRPAHSDAGNASEKTGD